MKPAIGSSVRGDSIRYITNGRKYKDIFNIVKLLQNWIIFKHNMVVYHSQHTLPSHLLDLATPLSASCWKENLRAPVLFNVEHRSLLSPRGCSRRGVAVDRLPRARKKVRLFYYWFWFWFRLCCCCCCCYCCCCGAAVYSRVSSLVCSKFTWGYTPPDYCHAAHYSPQSIREFEHMSNHLDPSMSSHDVTRRAHAGYGPVLPRQPSSSMTRKPSRGAYFRRRFCFAPSPTSSYLLLFETNKTQHCP